VALLKSEAELPVTVIQPSRGWVAVRFDELWACRELLFFFVWRDVKVRYKQTLLGASWAVLQPLLTMLIFTIFFGRMAGIGSEGAPYPIFSYAGLLPWTFFAAGLGGSSNSLVGAANLLKKVYFPRLIVPVASVLSGIVDFVVAFVLLLGMMVWYGVRPGPEMLLLPFFLLLAFGAALGAGLWLSALNVEFRDVRYVMPFFIQLLLFVTPVIYPASKVTAKLEEMGLPGWLYGLNPMAGVIQGFRWSLLGSGMNPGPLLAAGTAVTVLLLVGGLFYFRRMERTFADVV
jgi:lipopolysaccharide transport system permease protein